MKKCFALILCGLIVFAAAGCSFYDYEGWSTISIDGCGTLMIPAEWDMYESDGYIYIVDQDNNPMMIETHSHPGVEKNDFGIMESNDFYANLRILETISSEGLSNSAIYGTELVETDGIRSQQFFLELAGNPYVSLVIWSETIDEHFVRKMASSFVLE